MGVKKEFVFLFFLCLGSLSISLPGWAHTLKTSSSELKIQANQAQWVIAVHEGDYDRKFRDKPESLVKRYLSKRLKLKRGDQPCALRSIDIQKNLRLQMVRFDLRFNCEKSQGDFSVFYNLFYGDWNHHHLARILWDHQEKTINFSQNHTQAQLSVSSRFNSFLAFLRLGIEHILVGYDHILFLLTLLLGARRLSHLFYLITAFTLAHTLSLALATLGYFQMGPNIVEPAIAASIVCLAAFDFFTPVKKETKAMIPVTFFFGLIHGLGFSQILKESGIRGSKILLPLFSFNFGVEIGQILIVGVLYGVLILLKRKFPQGYGVGRNAALALIGIVATYWFVIRL